MLSGAPRHLFEGKQLRTRWRCKFRLIYVSKHAEWVKLWLTYATWDQGWLYSTCLLLDKAFFGWERGGGEKWEGGKSFRTDFCSPFPSPPIFKHCPPSVWRSLTWPFSKCLCCRVDKKPSEAQGHRDEDLARPNEEVWPGSCQSEPRDGFCLNVDRTYVLAAWKFVHGQHLLLTCVVRTVILTGSITAGSPFCPFSPRTASI